MEIKRGAGAFGGNHGGAERMVGRAASAEMGAVARLELAQQDLGGWAFRGVINLFINKFKVAGKSLGCVVSGVFRAEGKAAHGDDAESAPLAVGDPEHDV